MESTKKRVYVQLTKGMVDQLDQLQGKYGENQVQVMQRALMFLHMMTFNWAPNDIPTGNS